MHTILFVCLAVEMHTWPQEPMHILIMINDMTINDSYFHCGPDDMACSAHIYFDGRNNLGLDMKPEVGWIT